MKKLPINAILYLVSLSSFGGMGLSIHDHFYPELVYDRTTRVKIIKDADARLQAGERRQGDRNVWDYLEPDYWKQFGEANLTGSEKKRGGGGVEPPPPPPPPVFDLNEIVQVICISHGGDQTRLVLKYLVEVEPPLQFRFSPQSSPVLASMSTIPRGRRNQHGSLRGANMPAAEPQIPPQHLKLDPRQNARQYGEDAGPAVAPRLWPPYDFVYLVEVAKDASRVTFEVRREKLPDGSWPRHEVLRNVLGLPQDVLRRLNGNDASRPQAKRESERPDTANLWTPVADTKEVSSGNWIIGAKDEKALSGGLELFAREVHASNYKGGSGKHKVNGIQFKKLSPRVQGRGIQQGDVLISINGQPTRSMAAAARIGRRLHRKGVRTFKLEILRQGQRQVVIYHARR